MNATRKQLEAQFALAKKNGWLPILKREAERSGTTTAHGLGFSSRETNMKNIRGDFRNGKYNGYGPMQIDIGTDPAFARSWSSANFEPGIVGGFSIYRQKVKDTQNCVGKNVKVRSRSFVGRAVQNDDLRRVATAAYNCGRWGHYHYSKENNVDSTTTGKDYSRDVYDRAIEFADMLEKAGIEPGAVQRELELQGKYARVEHLKRFGVNLGVTRVQLSEVPAEDPAIEAENRADYTNEIEAEPPPVAIEEAPPADEGTGAVVEVTKEEPNQEAMTQTADTLAGKVKAWYAAIPTTLTGLITGIVAWAQGARVEIVVCFFASGALIGISYVIGNLLLKNAREKRAFEAEQKERDRTFELNKIKLQSAAAKGQNTVDFTKDSATS